MPHSDSRDDAAFSVSASSLYVQIQAEAELIQAIVLLFERLGITSSDVGIRLSSRKVSAHYLLLYILASIFCFCD
jgi:N-acetyl-anhydromuramyl-L-alanine amidase AmpD